MNSDDKNIINAPDLLMWRKDLNSIFSSATSELAKLLGFSKPEQLVSLSDYDIPCKISELADVFRKHDQHVIKTKSKIKFLEIISCKDNVTKILITTKSPTYDKNGNINGTMGYAMDCTDLFVNMPSIITKIKNHNQQVCQNTYLISDTQKDIILTRRQSECIFLLVRGKSGREIANILNLSIRTIEHYLETIKIKFNCATKYELVDKLLEQGYSNFIPSWILRKQMSIIV